MAPPAEPDPPPKKLTLKSAEFESVNESASVPPPMGNDPMEMLRLNREHEKKIGYAEIPPSAPTPRISRRNREYLFFLATGNLLLGGMMLISNNIFLLAAIALYSASLTWVMIFIFDDY